MIGCIEEVTRSGRDWFEEPQTGRGGTALLSADCRPQHNAQETVRCCPPERDIIAVIGFGIDKAVGRCGSAYDMGLYALGKERDGVLVDIEDSPVVIRPDDFLFHVRSRFVEHPTRGDILDPETILETPDLIFGPGDQAVVWTDLILPDVEIAFSGRHRTLVQQDFLGRSHAAFAPRDNGIILSFAEAGVVVITVLEKGHTRVVGRGPARDFLVDLVFQRLERCKDCVGVGIFFGECGKHFRILAAVVAQPVIFVLPGCSERRRDLVRLLRSNRRSGPILSPRRVCPDC